MCHCVPSSVGQTRPQALPALGRGHAGQDSHAGASVCLLRSGHRSQGSGAGKVGPGQTPSAALWVMPRGPWGTRVGQQRRAKPAGCLPGTGWVNSELCFLSLDMLCP